MKEIRCVNIEQFCIVDTLRIVEAVILTELINYAPPLNAQN